MLLLQEQYVTEQYVT